jgi:cell fate regulator YaaT (PSP1 superfamily)
MKDERGVQVVAIRFQPHGKLYHFDARRVPDLQLGDYVIVSTSRGREMGQIVQVYADAPEGQNGSRKPIERRATAQELVMRRMWQRRELEALIECRAKAAELEEDMVKIVTAEYSFDGSRLTYLYSSEGDEKIDLKDLRREMRKIYRTTQVNFRQIGPRDGGMRPRRALLLPLHVRIQPNLDQDGEVPGDLAQSSGNHGDVRPAKMLPRV